MRKDIKLGIDCASVRGFGHHLYADETILIFQTAHSVGARWLALSMAPRMTVRINEEELDPRQILLRVNDYCFHCAIDQAATQSGEWFIIL